MRHLRNPYVQVGLWTFAITLVVGTVVWALPWEPEQASTQAGPIDTLYDVLALISAFIFALVCSILITAVIHFRKRSPDDLRDGDPLHGNTRLEIVWTAIPAILMVGAAVYSGLVLADIEESKAGTRTVEVTAEQFAWTFEYADGEQFRSGELHLVKDTPYHFKLNAKDVIHSFWVPQFRLKKDAVPGIETDVRVTPKRLGRYTLACTELCGLGHSTMRATVIVEDQAAFNRWAQRQRSGRGPQAGGVVSQQGGQGAGAQEQQEQVAP
ncbi:MAG TPA: cytochrome c oxidase subunit II [Solirubrobacterales bacterium]|nr:cytochrome c oxidase subunit II [Solirubrobacterales bacterium]